MTEREVINIEIRVAKSDWLDENALRREIEDHLGKLAFRLATGGCKLLEVKLKESHNGK
jgi:hypothetical protein